MAGRELRVEIVGDASSLQKALGSATKTSDKFGSSIAKMGKLAVAGFAAAGAAAATGIGIAVVKAAEFEKGMRNVNTIAQLSEGQLKSLSDQVLKLAGPTAQAPKVLAAGLYDIVSSGFKAKDATKILAVSAKAASAGLTDTATATKAVTAALNAYHLGAQDARKVSDVLFETVNKGVLTFEELAQNMGDMVPAAAPLGVSLEEVGASIATITLQGVPAAEAATRVKNAMLQLAKPSANLSALFKEQGYESGEAAVKALGFVGVLQLIQKETGGSVTETSKLTPEIRALLGVVGLTGKNLATYEANLRAMSTAQEGSGASAKAFAEQAKSVDFQWNKVKVGLDVLAITIGTKLLPIINQALKFLVANMPQISAVMEQAMDGLMGAVASAAGAVRRNFEAIKAVAIAAFGGMKSAIQTAVGFLKTDFGQTLGTGLVAILALRGGMNALGISIGGVGKALSGLARNPFWALAIPLGLLVGEIAGNFIQSKIAAAQLAEAMDKAAGSARGLKDSLDALKDANLGVKEAHLAHEQALLRVEQAQKAVRAASDGTKKVTEEEKAAALGLKEAKLGLERADLSLTEAIKRQTDAHAARNQKIREGEQELNKLTTEAGKANGTFAQTGAMESYSASVGKIATEAAKTSIKAREMGDEAGSRAAGKVALLAKAAEDLTQRLGRVPSKKEIIAEAKLQGKDKTIADINALIAEMSNKKGVAYNAGLGIGWNLGTGTAAGIAASKVTAVLAAVSLVLETIAAMKSAAEEKSESKATMRIGRDMGGGLATGIAQKLAEMTPSTKDKTKQFMDEAFNILDTVKAKGYDLGNKQVQAVIDGVLGKTPSLKQQIMTAIDEANTAALQRVIAAKAQWADAWGQLAQAGIDAIAQKYADWKPPALIKLEQMQAEDAKKQVDSAVTSAQQALDAAKLEGAALPPLKLGEVPSAEWKAAEAKILAAQDALDAAVRAQVEFNLGLKAAQQQAAHDKEVAAEQANFQKDLKRIEKQMAAHKLTWEQGQDKIIALFKTYKIDYRKAGKALGESFADGIKDGLAAVGSAVEELANAIAAKLKRSSPAPKEGPLRDIDKWGARLMESFISGFNANLINKELNKIKVPDTFQRPPVLEGLSQWSEQSFGGVAEPTGSAFASVGIPSWANASLFQFTATLAMAAGKFDEFMEDMLKGRSNARLLDLLYQNRSRWNWAQYPPWITNILNTMRDLGLSGMEAAPMFGLKEGGITQKEGWRYLHAPEAVIPLNDSRADRYLGGSSRGSITVVLEGGTYIGGDPDAIARDMAPALNTALGKLPRSGTPLAF